MTPSSNQDAAQRAAMIERVRNLLFVNGSGKAADRLVLTVDSDPPRDLGGWSPDALWDQIDVLADEAREAGIREALAAVEGVGNLRVMTAQAAGHHAAARELHLEVIRALLADDGRDEG